MSGLAAARATTRGEATAARLRLQSVSKTFGAKCVAQAIDLEIERGEFFTFLGASGSGKSTLLRIIAGLEAAGSGRVLIQGVDVDGLPPWKRNVGMVFQDYAIFPHMNVARNVGYGLEIRGLSRAERDRRAEEMLTLVGLPGMGERSVHTLSGGERQRVALARALAPEPSMMLLDEPLSALDEAMRRSMQQELKRIQVATGATFVYVTHDQEEALAMSDRIAVLENGRVAQVGSPWELFHRPRTRFVARFFRGGNVLDAEIGRGEDGRPRLALAGCAMAAPARSALPASGHVSLAIRAERVSIGAKAQERSTALSARVVEASFRGASLELHLALPDGQKLVATTPARGDQSPTGDVLVGFDAEDLHVLEEAA